MSWLQKMVLAAVNLVFAKQSVRLGNHTVTVDNTQPGTAPTTSATFTSVDGLQIHTPSTILTVSKL